MFLEIIVQCLLLFSLCGSHRPTLIVVSYDAFRYDFLDRNVTPHLNWLRSMGTYAEYLTNVFPTKTFPNHHSIATGLYPEEHGVIGNSFYDPEQKKVLKYGYEMFHYNDSVVPIWILNEMAGEGHHSGVMMWPGSSFKYQNLTPTYVEEWDPGVAWEERIDQVIRWIRDPIQPANLVMVYFEEPDTHGHAYGPNAPKMTRVIIELDKLARYLQDQLVKNNMTDYVNVIHLSDHGMTAVTPEHFINLTEYLSPYTYKMAGSTPCIHIIPDEEHRNEVFLALYNAAMENKHFTVYQKENMPKRWHFSNNPRTPPIFVLAEERYGFQDLANMTKIYAQMYNLNVTNTSEFGVHGYDYTFREMRPFFIARGPKFNKNHKVKPFETVDLFNLFCEVLEIKPIANDGDPKRITDLLINTTKQNKFNFFSTMVITVGGILLALLLISCAAAITLMMTKHQQKITTAAALNKRFPQNFHHSSIEVQHLLEPEDA